MQFPQLFQIESRHLFYFFTALITIGVAVIVSNILRVLLDKYFRSTSLSSKLDPTRYAFAKNAVSLIIFILATVFIFSTIPSLRTLGLTIFASAGIFAAIIGFASQAAFSNIISGIFIVIFKPFRVEDVIKVGKDFEGVVEDITLRHTVLRNVENKRIIIPNAVVSNEIITNASLTDEKVKVLLDLNISHDSNTEKALQLLEQEALKHPLRLDVRNDEERAAGKPPVKVRVIALTETAVTIRAWIWAADTDAGFEMKCDLLKSMKELFEKEHILFTTAPVTILKTDQQGKDFGKD